MASHRGRHRRPSKAARIIAPAAVGITAAGAMMTFAGGAQAQALPQGTASPGAAVKAFALIHANVPERTASEEEVTVHSGDTLSGLAGKYCGNPADWTGWWNYNHRAQHWSSPNIIEVGQRLIPDCRDEQVWLPQPRPAYRTVSYNTPVRATSYQAHTSYGNTGSYGNVNAASYGGIQSCIISRESGGNSQVMNPSRHYGLYQFDYGTWVSGGGNGADFGHASVGEQQRVFANVYAARGAEPWAPSDGC